MAKPKSVHPGLYKKNDDYLFCMGLAKTAEGAYGKSYGLFRPDREHFQSPGAAMARRRETAW